MWPYVARRTSASGRSKSCWSRGRAGSAGNHRRHLSTCGSPRSALQTGVTRCSPTDEDLCLWTSDCATRRGSGSSSSTAWKAWGKLLTAVRCHTLAPSDERRGLGGETGLADAYPTESSVKNEDSAPPGKVLMDQSPCAKSLALDALIASSMSQDPVQHANAMIDTLVRVVVAVVRQPLLFDRYENAQGIKLKTGELSDQERDRDYLSHGRFTDMDPELRDRILSANLQRRKFLQYTREHRNKLADLAGPAQSTLTFSGRSGLDRPPADEDAVSDRPTDESSSAFVDEEPSVEEEAADSVSETSHDSSLPATGSSMSEHEQDDATTPRDVPFPAFVDEEAADNASETSQETSSSEAGSILSEYEQELRVPEFPEKSENGLRTCPCCYALLRFRNERSWKYVSQPSRQTYL